MDGYKEAEKIDAIISGLLESDPINHDNTLQWLAFARTIETTLFILRSACEELLSKPDTIGGNHDEG